MATAAGPARSASGGRIRRAAKSGADRVLQRARSCRQRAPALTVQAEDPCGIALPCQLNGGARLQRGRKLRSNPDLDGLIGDRDAQPAAVALIADLGDLA